MGHAIRVLRRAGGLLLGALLTASCEPSFDGVAIDPPRAMPAFTFVRADGARVSTVPAPGQYTVLFFGYTHCPDVCPTTMADWTRVKAQLGAKAAQVRFLLVSVDPERDTPAVVEAYARRFDTQFIGLSGTPMQTAAILQAYGIAATPEMGADHAIHLVSHSSQVHLLDDAGRLIALYPSGTPWQALATDLARRL
jgi:protein SCO1/2